MSAVPVPLGLAAGDWLYVEGYKRPFTVRACDDRFAVCTRPFMGTVLYFVADFEEGVRGPEGLVFGAGAETDEDCRAMIDRLNGRGRAAPTAVSRRNRVALVLTGHRKHKSP